MGVVTHITINKAQGKIRTTLIITAALITLLTTLTGGALAAQTNESLGPGGYGWQQAYSTNGSGYAWERITASADRDFYDYGYKPINIYVRLETYFSRDSGWWYVTGGKAIDVVLSNGTTTFNSTTTSPTSVASKGVRNLTYNWDSLSTSAPGRWNVTADDNGNYTLTFYIYVRGQLNVTSITNNSNQAGSPVTISATLKDHTGRLINGSYKDNAGQSAVPAVTLYATGAGENAEVTMSDGDNDAVWTASFTPNRPGDYKIIAKASDGHRYWVDGRGSTMLTVRGNFPYASAALPVFEGLFGALENSFATLLAVLISVGGGILALKRGRGGA